MHLLHRTQYLPITMEEGWEFFSDPYNLKAITPPDMEFEVESFSGQRNLHRGQIITYTVKPLFGVRVKWVTEITQADYPDFFVDEQLDGPFAFWHHKHYLKPINGGVKMIDSVHYKVPFGLLGELFHTLIIQKRLEEIFDYRHTAIRGRFGDMD